MKLVRCPNCGFVCKRNGKTNAGSQRWYCNQCSCSFTNKVNKTNNKIKVLKRISYGLRHFGRFRVCILLLSKKNGTNHNYDWCQRRLVG